MYQSFAYYNITFERKGTGSWVYAKGEIANNSGKDYNTALFRIVLFDKSLLLWSGALKVVDFRKGQTKYFELFMEGFDYRTVPSVTRYDIYFESGY